MYKKIEIYKNYLDSLFFANISRTIVGSLARKRARMCLYTVRIEDLHDPAKIDALHEIIDIRMPDIVAEYEKSLFNVFSLRKRDDKVPQISEPRMHLDDYNRCVAGQRSERLLIVHFLLRIRSLDLPPNFRDLQFRERSRTGIRQVCGRVTSLLQKSEIPKC